jgi:ribokinase
MGIVVVLGSLMTDLVARAPRLPHTGESLIGDDFSTFLGGKGINQAIAARRLGAEVTMIGRVGADTFGDAFFPVLAQEGIESTYVEHDPTIGTGVALIVIAEDSGQNAIVAMPQANLAIPASTVGSALHAILSRRTQPDELTIFLAQCETNRESYLAGLQHARAFGMLTILNAAPIPREPLDDDVLALIDILVVNEVEASALARVQVTSADTAQAAAMTLLARGPQQVIVTLGVQGCLWSKREENTDAISHQFIPPFLVKAVDATAAGDTFCGALAAGLASGTPIGDAMRRASAASAITVTRRGATAAIPTAAEVEAFLKNL